MLAPAWAVLIIGVLVIAVLYSSVGHGGASGYLAVLVLVGFARPAMTPVVLLLNLVVAGIGFTVYHRAGHFSHRLLVPFAVTSVPAAALGAMIPVDERVYAGVLGSALLLAACRFLLLPRPVVSHTAADDRVWIVGPPIGFALGLLAGMVGIGGGIFLSPLLLLMGWADAKRTGAVSAGFIVVNSISGLTVHLVRGAALDWSVAVPLLATVAVGGVIGSSLGATRFSLVALQRLLGVVLAMAGLKLTARLW